MNTATINTNQVSIKTATVDLLWVLTTLLIIKNSLLQFPAWWTYAGPIALTSAFLVATWRLKRQNQSWRSLGLFIYPGHLRMILWTLAALVITVLAGALIASLVGQLIEPATQTNAEVSSYQQNRFATLPGNWLEYLYWLAIAWVIGGFVEELLFRGFLILRTERVLAQFSFAVTYSILLQALLFGQQHYYYLGFSGFMENTVIAIISGILFVLFKRQLWPLILSHAIANTIGITLIFLSGI